jgi:alkylation response protein AidB-like acyl-CoA dehydrogenase
VRLEKLLGDPFDTANPLGFAQVMAADERAELLAEGERVLAGWGCNDEFVPAGLGGRWSAVDDLARRLRPVFRRDSALGLGYGVTSLMAAVNVWVAGDAARQRKLGDDLRAGRRAAIAFHELDHGNDLMRNTFRARPGTGGIILDGRKEVINNAGRADAMLLFARTDDRPGPRGHSLLLLDKENLNNARFLPRYRTSGVRGCQLGGIEFTDHLVPADTLVGAAGTGTETALRAFQVTRTVLPAMALGVLDSALHVGYRFVTGRRLYGQHVADLPHAREALTTAFADLLVADCLATTVARGLQLAPGHAAPAAAAVKYLVPLILEEAMGEVAVVLGARSYLRQGPQAIVGKFLRDLPVLGIGHAGGMSCLRTIVPQLPVLARRAWRAARPPAELFGTDRPLPELDFTRLSIAASQDQLAASLLAAADQVPAGEPVRPLILHFVEEFGQLTEDVRALPPTAFTSAAGEAALGLAERYTVLLAVAACVGTWLDSPQSPGTAWLHIALTRLAARLRGTSGADLPERETEVLFAELGRRAEHNLSYCLESAAVFG